MELSLRICHGMALAQEPLARLAFQQCRARPREKGTLERMPARINMWVKIQIVPLCEHQPIPTKIGSKMGGEFTYPKMGSHWFLSHGQINLCPPGRQCGHSLDLGRRGGGGAAATEQKASFHPHPGLHYELQMSMQVDQQFRTRPDRRQFPPMAHGNLQALHLENF